MNKKSKLQMIPTDKLHPHPQNPRKVIGDVTELAESIKANGTHPIFTTGEVK